MYDKWPEFLVYAYNDFVIDLSIELTLYKKFGHF